MTQQHHEEAASDSEGEGDSNVGDTSREDFEAMKAAGIDGVGSGDGEAVLQRAPRWPA